MAPPTFAEIYPSRDSHRIPSCDPPRWRFRLRAHNGKIIASGEAYTRRRDAVRGALRVAPNATVKYVSR